MSSCKHTSYTVLQEKQVPAIIIDSVETALRSGCIQDHHLSSSRMSSTMMVCASCGTRDQWQMPSGKDIFGCKRPVPLLMMVCVLVSSETHTVSHSRAIDMASRRASACKRTPSL